MSDQQRKIDTYTRKTREKREGNTPLPLLLHHLRNGIEGVNRRFWYGMLRLILRNEPPSKKIPITELRSILIIPYGDAIGDLLVSSAAARVIRKRNPNCKIGIVTSPRNESLLRCDPDFDAQYPFTGRSDKANYKNLRRARQENYQVVLNIHFQRMSDYGLISNYISPRGIKVSTQHKRGEMYRILFNHLTEAERFQVQISQLGLKLLDDVIDFGARPIAASESRPVVHVCPDVLQRVKDDLERRLREVGAEWFIYINPQARHPRREWGQENILAYAKAVLSRHSNAAVFITASPVAQDEWRLQIASLHEPRLQFVETGYDLNELASICRLSRLIMTPDTAVVHLASAERKPCIVFYTNPQIPREWLPLQTPSFLFSPENEGEPVSSVSVSEVLEATERLLSGMWIKTATSVGLSPSTLETYQETEQSQNLIDLIDPAIRQTSIYHPDGE